jgi:hypothetical protein
MYIVCFLMGISFCCAVFVGAEKVKASIERRRMAQVEREGRLQSIERGLARKMDDAWASSCLEAASKALVELRGRVEVLEALHAAPVVPNA